MGSYHWISVLTCGGHLTLALLGLLRAGTSRLALLVALLALDMFVWNAADVAADVISSRIWDQVDHVGSTLTMPLAFHFVLAFLGHGRRLRVLIVVSYTFYLIIAALVLFGPLAASREATIWAALLFAGATVELGISLVLLGRALRRERAPLERARVRLVMVALIAGVALAMTDLLQIMGIDAPRLSNLGTLASAVLLGVVAFRFRLFEAVSRMELLAAASLGFTLLVGYAIVFNFARTHTALLVVATATITLLGVAGVAVLARSIAEQRARVEYLATLGRFAEQMAHDLRNPIASVKGAVQFLAEERAQGRSIDGREDFLRLIDAQSDRMERVVAEYQRLGRVEPITKPADVNEIVRDGVAAFVRVSGAQVAVTSDLAPSLPECAVDRAAIEGVLENLLRNAREAIDGEGRITVRTRSDGPEGSGIVIEVEDTGRGMDPRVRERALDDFFTTKPGGTGLGLSHARRVAEAHGGALSIESAEGRGTKVSLRLPRGW